MAVLFRVVPGILVLAGCSSAAPPSPSLAGATARPTSTATAVPTSDPEAVACPNPGGGACLGNLEAGRHTTTEFARPITYTVPAGWQNMEDLPGNFLLLAPGESIGGVDAGTADYVGAGLRTSAASRDCTSEELAARPEPGVDLTPAAIAAELAARPGLIVTPPRGIAVGGLQGVVIDIQIDPTWSGTCFYSDGEPTVPLIHGLPPSDFDHSMLAGFETRLYLLGYEGESLGIEIQVVDLERLPELAAVAESFSFLDPRPALPSLVDGQADPCLPLCATGIQKSGRPLSANRRYQTQWFFGGYLTMTPTIELSLLGDSTGDLVTSVPNDPEYHIGFALDLYPVKDGQRVAGVPNTAEGLIAWLRGNEYYEVSENIPARIGALPATAVDVRLSDAAPQQYDDCGAPCVDMYSFEQWSDNGGIRGDDLYRIYFANIEYGGTPHLFVVEVQNRDRAHLDSRIPVVEGLLASVTVPAVGTGS